MQNGHSLRAVVDICGIPLTTLRNYRKRGIISPDVADKKGKFTLYSDAQIELAKAYRSEHPPKHDKTYDAETDDSTSAESNTASKKAYLVNPPDSLGVKFNRLNVYLGDNGAFEVDAHFDTTNIETAYRRFVDFFLQAAADIPALNGYDHFPPAKKFIKNANGWENEFGEQIFFQEANESLCVDINEDFIYIFGKFNQHTQKPVAEPQHDLVNNTNDEATISTDQPVALEPASVIDTESLIAEPLENKTLDELADEANHYAAQGDACFEQGLNFYFAAGRPVEKQSASEVQRNVKAFKQQLVAKKVPDDYKLPTLQGLDMPLDVPDDTPPDSPVTIEPELVDNLNDNHADVLAAETNDNIDIVDHDVASDTLPAVETIPATMNASTDLVTNLVDMPAQITAVNALIAKTNDPQQLQAIRVSLAETLASLDAKLDALAQKNFTAIFQTVAK